MSNVVTQKEGTTTPSKPHTVQTDNCKRSYLTGVTEVLSTAETAISLVTTCGTLVIEGSDIRIIKFNSDACELVIEGSFVLWRYNVTRAKAGFFKRLFR